MPYGRFDIFWPDGLFKTFPLSEPNISVGRSSGNTVMLDNSTISRYHFSLSVIQGQVYITDLESANGTYVDGVRLPSNEQYQLDGGEEIQIGNLRIIYHHIDDTPTQLITTLDDTTQRIELSLPEFSVDIHGPDQSVAPGAYVSAELSIANTSGEDQRFNVEVTGPPKEWVRIDRPTPFVEAGDNTFVLINFKPLRRSDSKPGDYATRIRVYPHEKPTAVIETTLMLRVMPYGGFGMTLESNKISGSEFFQLHLHNQGSDNLPLSIGARDRSDALRFNILAPLVTLTPGQQVTVQGEVKPKRTSLFGSPRQLPFDLIVRSNNHAGFLIANRAYYVEKPLLPGWTMFFLLGAIGLFVLLTVAAIALILGRPAPEPHVALFQVNSTQIARGESLEVSWQATDVANVRLLLNGTPVVVGTADPQASSFVIDTSDLSGPVEVVLEGSNGSKREIVSQTVNIYEPMRIDSFTVAPDQVVRYVTQSLAIEWNVPGAVSTRVTGLENFNSTALDVLGASGSFGNITGILLEPLTVTLHAEDALGNTLEQPLTINVLNPECRPASASVSLYAGPDVNHQVVGTVPADVGVVVDAQDLKSQWLRVSGLTGGLSGWGKRTDFTCNDNFSIDDLRKELNVPPPPPTLTPTPPTATPTAMPTRAPAITPTTAG